MSTVLVEYYHDEGVINAAEYCDAMTSVLSRYENYRLIWVVLIMEHCIFFFKAVLTIVVPNWGSKM